MANQQVATFAAQLKSYNDRDQKSIDGIIADEAESARLIKQLQDSAGETWTPEDQAALDGLDALAKAKTEKLEALDNNLPPPVPVVP